MASYSANTLIARALSKARVIHPGETPKTAIANQILDNLNGMLELWSVDLVAVIADTEESFQLTASDADYSWGSGGDFNSARPISIKDETYIRLDSTDHPCKLLPIDVYRNRSTKGSTGIPRIMSYLPSYTTMMVYFWPTPNSSSLYAKIKSTKQLSSFSTLASTVDLAPGYYQAIVENLAVRISPDFGKKVSDALASQAYLSYQTIANANKGPVRQMRTPHLAKMAGGRSGDNILTGPFGG